MNESASTGEVRNGRTVYRTNEERARDDAALGFHRFTDRLHLGTPSFRWVIFDGESTTYTDPQKAKDSLWKLWNQYPRPKFRVWVEKYDGRKWKFAGKFSPPIHT